MLKFAKKSYLLTLAIFIPFLLPLGEVWADWLACTLFILVIVSCFYRIEPKPNFSIPLFALPFFLLAIFALLNFSPYITQPTAFIYCLAGTLVIVGGNASLDYLKAGVFGLIVAALSAVIVSWIQYGSGLIGYDMPWFVYQGLGVSGQMGQRNHLTTLLCLGVAPLVFLFEINKIKLVFLFLLLFFLGSALGVVGSRSVFIYLIALLIVAAIGRARGTCQRQTIYAMCWLFFVVILFQLGISLLGISTSAVNRLMEEGVFASRLPLWQEALFIFQQNSFFGVGAGGFAFHKWQLEALGVFPPYNGGEVSSQPHNVVLQLMVEYGLLGIMAIIAWGSLLFASWRNRDGDSRWLLGWMFMMPLLLHSLIEYPLNYPYFLLPFAFFSGALFYNSNKYNYVFSLSFGAQRGVRVASFAIFIFMLLGVWGINVSSPGYSFERSEQGIQSRVYQLNLAGLHPMPKYWADLALANALDLDSMNYLYTYELYDRLFYRLPLPLLLLRMAYLKYELGDIQSSRKMMLDLRRSYPKFYQNISVEYPQYLHLCKKLSVPC